MKDVDRPVSVGLVGTGHWARTMHAPMHAGDGPTRLAGVWGRDPRRTAAIAAEHQVPAFGTFDELLESCEAVDFAVPPAVQAELAPVAAGRGRAVLLEKPLGLSLTEARDVAGAVEAAGVANLVVLTKRYHHRTRAFLEEAAALRGHGPVLGASSRYLHGGFLQGSFAAGDGTTWRSGPLGALRDLGPHVLDLLDLAVGRIASVRVDQSGDAFTTLTTWHDEGPVAQTSLSGHVGTDAVLTDVDVYSSAGVARYSTAGMDHGECWATVRAEFAAAVRHGAPVTVDVHRAVQVAALVDAAERSWTSGGRVDLPPAV
ncbi:Gfo/Idh/MocA family protein [Cellulomonas sp. PhB143]|uniref:Gfo/Idh/MocA family protein n=1 Tax=Cellulomonas sp. PhB143 TaxID=2485186 RepID=UPI000F48ED10|nr:Gfo/Idh/MocA family oxidoreductase [Cellulomonas sp. PhB143]ROS75468.1 putative dehydrogenase [Cellulomonas sp. PhB143]